MRLSVISVLVLSAVTITSSAAGARHTASAVRASGWTSAEPSWSPDSTQIAFTSEGTFNHSGVYVMNANGTGAHRLHDRAWQPAWSSGGQRIAYVQLNVGTAPDELEVMRADGSAVQRVAKQGWQPSWSPDSQTLAFRLNEGIEGLYAVNVDTGHRHLLGRELFQPAWSPDGRQIAYAEYVRPCPRVPCTVPAALHVMNADGTHRRRLTHTTADTVRPTWAPGSRRLAYLYEPAVNDVEIWALDTRTGQRRRLAGNVDDDTIAWSPNGKWIAFSRMYRDGSQLYVMNADGSHQHRLTGPRAP